MLMYANLCNLPSAIPLQELLHFLWSACVRGWGSWVGQPSVRCILHADVSRVCPLRVAPSASGPWARSTVRASRSRRWGCGPVSGRYSPAFLSHLRQRSSTLRSLPATLDRKASLSASQTRLRCNLPRSRLGGKDSRPSGIWGRGPQEAPLGAWGSEVGHQGSVIKAVTT